ncbi:hypothetical protein HDZ31DRAFT_35512 [Schizophyllum fasciatum]
MSSTLFARTRLALRPAAQHTAPNAARMSTSTAARAPTQRPAIRSTFPGFSAQGRSPALQLAQVRNASGSSQYEQKGWRKLIRNPFFWSAFALFVVGVGYELGARGMDKLAAQIEPLLDEAAKYDEFETLDLNDDRLLIYQALCFLATLTRLADAKAYRTAEEGVITWSPTAKVVLGEEVANGGRIVVPLTSEVELSAHTRAILREFCDRVHQVLVSRQAMPQTALVDETFSLPHIFMKQIHPVMSDVEKLRGRMFFPNPPPAGTPDRQV